MKTCFLDLEKSSQGDCKLIVVGDLYQLPTNDLKKARLARRPIFNKLPVDLRTSPELLSWSKHLNSRPLYCFPEPSCLRFISSDLIVRKSIFVVFTIAVKTQLWEDFYPSKNPNVTYSTEIQRKLFQWSKENFHSEELTLRDRPRMCVKTLKIKNIKD